MSMFACYYITTVLIVDVVLALLCSVISMTAINWVIPHYIVIMIVGIGSRDHISLH